MARNAEQYRAVVCPMVEGHRDVAHRVDRDAVLPVVGGHGDRPHRHTVGRHDSHLWLVDDRTCEQGAVAAGVRDRERAPGEIVGGQPLRVRLLREVGRGRGELGDRLVLRVADDGHDQALEVEIDGDAEMDCSVDHQLVVDHRRIEARELRECVDDGAHHEREVREAGPAAHLVDGLVVDFDRDERVSGRAQRLGEVRGRALADVAERHDAGLDARSRRARCRRARCRWWRCRRWGCCRGLRWRCWRRGSGLRDLAVGLGDHGEPGSDGHGVALGDEDLDDLPGDGRRHLGVDLVSGHLEQGFVDGDALADLLAPSNHRAFGDCLTELRHRDVHWS